MIEAIAAELQVSRRLALGIRTPVFATIDVHDRFWYKKNVPGQMLGSLSNAVEGY